jgi:glycosyltransferase involved in cell wall biosynthesis
VGPRNEDAESLRAAAPTEPLEDADVPSAPRPSLIPGNQRDQSAALAELAREVGIRAVKFVAWRDLEDPEAGGSELHAHRVATQWAAAGIDVTVRTSAVPGRPERAERDGYHLVRRSGRYAIFPRVAFEGMRSRQRDGEALVEVWNGMPFFSPLWYRGPRIVFLHHVHAEMFRMVLPRAFARVGETIERRIAPPRYGSSRVVTLSSSSRDEIVEVLGFDPERVSIAPPGIDPRFTPGPGRSPDPLVVAVGRLVPVKRFDLLIEALVRARVRCPELRAVIIGEGFARAELEAMRRRHGAERWLELPGRLNDDEVLDYYRRAWVVASTSQREGWGMTLTEAAACATPSVATDIAGHRDAVLHGRSGLLTDGVDGIADALGLVLTNDVVRKRLSRGALERARWFSWEATAMATFEALANDARARRPITAD